MTLFADDPDAHRVYPITNGAGAPFDFAPVVLARQGETVTEVDASWVSDPGASRDLRVSLSGLEANVVTSLRLNVPGDNDIELEELVLA